MEGAIVEDRPRRGRHQKNSERCLLLMRCRAAAPRCLIACKGEPKCSSATLCGGHGPCDGWSYRSRGARGVMPLSTTKLSGFVKPGEYQLSEEGEVATRSVFPSAEVIDVNGATVDSAEFIGARWWSICGSQRVLPVSVRCRTSQQFMSVLATRSGL